MKRIGVAVMAAVMLAACGASSPETTAQPEATVAAADPVVVETTPPETPPPTTVKAEAAEAADVVATGPCVSDDFGLITMPITVTNASSKRSDYNVEGVIEQGGAKVGDLMAFVENVEPGGKALDKMTSFDTITGAIECRIVKVDRTEAL